MPTRVIRVVTGHPERSGYPSGIPVRSDFLLLRLPHHLLNTNPLPSHLNLLPPSRYHHCVDHDHLEFGGQELAATGLLRDGHGPLCHRLLPVRLRRHDRVRHAQLLLLQRPPASPQDAENGMFIVKTSVSSLYVQSRRFPSVLCANNR